MEKKIGNKARVYFQNFKEDIRGFIESNCDLCDTNKANLLQFVYDYQPLEFTKQDFQKRKRVKNIVPFCDRCCALRANKEQCTRRRKDGSKFCGTHTKGIPHGEVDQVSSKPTHTKKTVWAQDIKGIIYYIDDTCNVYDPRDVIENKINPKIIAKYQRIGNNYSIPSMFKK